MNIHIDKTSLDYIGDKEDLYRDERNIYLYAGAFFTSLANIRYLSHLHDHQEMEEQVDKLKKQLKNE